MNTYVWVFVNFKQDNLAKLLSITEFTNNNAKNISNGHTLFKFNRSYLPCTSYEKNVDLYFQLKSADQLVNKPKELMTVWKKNL